MDSPHRLAACVLEIKITALQTHFLCGLNIHTHARACTLTHTCVPVHVLKPVLKRLRPLALGPKTDPGQGCFLVSSPVTAGTEFQELLLLIIMKS